MANQSKAIWTKFLKQEPNSPLAHLSFEAAEPLIGKLITAVQTSFSELRELSAKINAVDVNPSKPNPRLIDSVVACKAFNTKAEEAQQKQKWQEMGASETAAIRPSEH